MQKICDLLHSFVISHRFISSMRSLFRLDIHIIYSEFISQSSNYTVRDNPKSRTQG